MNPIKRREFLIGLAGGLAAAPALLLFGKAAPAATARGWYGQHRGVLIRVARERQGDLTIQAARFLLDSQPLGFGARIHDEERMEKPGIMERYRKALIRSCRHTIDWHFYKIRLPNLGRLTYAQWMLPGAPIPLVR